jgi:predicted nucleotidyltransferase
MVKRILPHVQHAFGTKDIYLFGSRTDDSKRGGDIDLAVDTNLSRSFFRQKKICCLSSLLRTGFEYKIDIVPFQPNDPLLAHEIRSTAIKLT